MYYKIRIHLTKTVDDPDVLAVKSESANQQLALDKNESIILAMAMLKKKDLIMMGISTIEFDLKGNLEDEVRLYLDRCGLEFDALEVSMMTLKDISRTIRSIEQNENRKNTGTVLFNDLDNIYFRLPNFKGDSFEVEDTIVAETKPLPSALTLRASFKQELKLIESQPGSTMLGHPVHYMIECGTYEEAYNAAECLVSALYKNKRLLHSHIVRITLNTSPRSRFFEDLKAENYSLKNIISKLGLGGATVIDISDSAMGVLAKKESDEALDVLARDILLYRHSTLFVFITDDLDGKFITALKEKLTKLSFVILKEGPLDYDSALKQIAKKLEETHMDPALAPQLLEEGKTLYTPNELSLAFSDWVDNYMRNQAFPQYAHIKPFELAVIEEVQGKAYEELQALIGLSDVKALVDDFLAAQQAQRFYAQQGMSTPTITKHMIFTGTPGTAKTTVARLLGKIMRDNGLLSVGDFIEVSRADLIEKYVGWTAKNVRKIFQQAKGSIVFIDEAYSLMDHHESSFGDEAIATIVSEMENARGDIMVIFAGYPKEMEEFIQRNPGLKSRINFQLHFKDYTLDELLKIAIQIARNNGFELSESAIERIRKLTIPAMSKPGYGNGRFIRNLIDTAILHHGSRLYKKGFDSLTAAEIKTLDEEDYPVPDEDLSALRLSFRTQKRS